MYSLGNFFVDNLDYLIIVDRNYKILYSTRHNIVFNENADGNLAGADFFDVFKLSKSESTIARSIEEGQIIVAKHQKFTDSKGKEFITDNITIPIIVKGNVMGAIELSCDVTDELNMSETNERFNNFVENVIRDDGEYTFDDILTMDSDMINAIENAKLLSKNGGHILVYGETGTGKELFAQSIITESGISRDKVVVLNCAAIPKNLIESTLFGTTKGAYTGAEDIKGLFETADHGIIFLDELNSMPYDVQSKLLRVIQDGTFISLGSNEIKKTTARIIAAINVDPMDAINNGSLRADLFYRFSNGLIRIPALRERPKDITFFTAYYTDYFAKMYSKKITDISQEVLEMFYEYRWEGNVRELKNTIESMIALSDESDTLKKSRAPRYLERQIMKQRKETGIEDVDELSELSYREKMDAIERTILIEALVKAKGNKTEASRILKMPRKTLEYRLEKLGVEI
ncbi:MAG: sigma 54-interacting transcriptional regulator [Clostridia bacterium]|nr:sigma 54-interacting transcriptional regulator [Clostridia bacterium]